MREHIQVTDIEHLKQICEDGLPDQAKVCQCIR